MTTEHSLVREPRPEDPVPDEFDVLCERCSYSLVGLTCDRCPECGHPFDSTELPLARVPWLYRRRIGTLAAYGKTWRMILARPREFAAELCRPVRISQQDARLFRRRAIRGAVLTAAGLAAIAIGWLLWQEWRGGGLPNVYTDPKPYALIAAGYIGGIVATWIFLTLSTDLPTFIWQGLDRSPEDLAPLHHYASAPLALAPFAFVLVSLAALIAGDADHGPRFYAVVITTALCVGTIILLLWRVPQLLMAVGTGCPPRRVRALAMYLPVHWLIIGTLSALIFLLFIVPPAWYFQ